MKDFMKWIPFIFAAIVVMVWAIKSDDLFPESPDIIEQRPQGCYTLTGMYSEGFVIDEEGQVWEYHAGSGFDEQEETMVVINFHGFGTPELEDDVVIGLSHGLLQEAYCSSAFADEETGIIHYQFKNLDGEYFWVFSADELGFTPVVGDQILVCYTDNYTVENPYDDKVIYTRVL
jgi:hypothetical protein